MYKMTVLTSNIGSEYSGNYLNENIGLLNENAGFGFRSLTIIVQKNNGHRPLSNDEGSNCIVFNGAIDFHLTNLL